MNVISMFFWIFVCLTIVNQTAGRLAVMSVDLGSEWLKIGIVSPGVPMEIVLNKESKRKDPAIISFQGNMRSFGEEAQGIGIKSPQKAYSYLLDLLGKDINHPVVKLFQKQFPYYKIIQDSQRGTILFQHDNEIYYTVEELIAQILTRAKEYAELGSKQPIKECVLTVPGFFNQAERKALLQAAELADLKVLQLINDYTAVALNYGIFRIKDFNETSQYIMFVDIGASSTTATVVGYQTVKTKERGYVETHPQLTILGVGYDRTLGGRYLQLTLRDYLATKFNEMKKTPKNVFENPRAMAKLYKEAGRLKNILSANLNHYAQIEGLLDDIDFKLSVTRDEFESMSTNFFERIKGPVQQAINTAGLAYEHLNQVVLFGASTRIPKVQEILKDLVGQDLAKNLNTDEAAAMGAAYKAADLSSGFQVKKFITKNSVIFPIQVVFERESEGTVKQVKRTLFGHTNIYPQKKIITFNKHYTDFSFNVNYAELDHLPAEEILHIGSLNLTEISLLDVADVFTKHTGDNVESKGIKAHFALDDSGILKFLNAELVVEKTIHPEDNVEKEEGTFSKLGSTITKLFSGENEAEEKKPDEKPDSASKDTEDILNKDSKPSNETESKNVSKEEPPKDTKPKQVTVKEPIKVSEKILHIEMLNTEQFQESVQKLEKLAAYDREVNRRADALNSLEGFVIDIRNKLDEQEYAVSATPEESEKILASCSHISDWMYEDGSEANAETYELKLKELKLLSKDFYTRIFEHKERPEAINALHSIIEGSLKFLETAKNFTKSNPEKDVFTNVEIETLQKVIEETTKWETDMVNEQKKLKKSDPVVLTVKLISEKMALVDREVKYLVNKLKNWKPKKVEKPKDETKPEADKKLPEDATSTVDEQKESEESTPEVDVEPTVEEPVTIQEEGETIDATKVDSDTGDTHSEL